MTGFLTNIEDLTLRNENFRQVLYTGQHAQLVVMSLKPSEEIGEETHEIVDQFLRIEAGQGKLVINGQEQEFEAGAALIVPAGATHNVINTSSDQPLKLYTLYSPPHHKPETIHTTKKAAQEDTQDHI